MWGMAGYAENLVTPSYPTVERGAPLLTLCQAARPNQCDLERDGTSL